MGDGGGFGVAGGNGLDEASDGEGIPDTAGAADEVSGSAFASELDGDADEGGDAGAVNLRDAVEVDDDLATAALDDSLERLVELLGGLADGQAAADLEEVDAVFFANGDFHRQMFSHRECPRQSKRPERERGLYDFAKNLDNSGIKFLNRGHENF
jgi:hypothetical protein